MRFVKIYIHLVWATKNRYPYLNSHDLRRRVWDHIMEKARLKDIFIDYINGYSDHWHCLVSLGTNQTIEKTMQLIKGESAFWINRNKLTKEKFEWQDEYFAISVSESMIERVRNYIMKQEQHHSKKTFQEEYDELISKFNFQKFKGPSDKSEGN